MKTIRFKFDKNGDVKLHVRRLTNKFYYRGYLENQMIKMRETVSEDEIVVPYQPNFIGYDNIIFLLDTQLEAKLIEGKNYFRVYKVNGEQYIVDNEMLEPLDMPYLTDSIRQTYRMQQVKEITEFLKLSEDHTNAYSSIGGDTQHLLARILNDHTEPADAKRIFIPDYDEEVLQLEAMLKTPLAFATHTYRKTDGTMGSKKKFEQEDYEKAIGNSWNFNKMLSQESSYFDDWFARNYTSDRTWPLVKLVWHITYLNQNKLSRSGIGIVRTLQDKVTAGIRYNQYREMKSELQLPSYDEWREEIDSFDDNMYIFPYFLKGVIRPDAVLKFKQLKTSYPELLEDVVLEVK